MTINNVFFTSGKWIEILRGQRNITLSLFLSLNFISLALWKGGLYGSSIDQTQHYCKSAIFLFSFFSVYHAIYLEEMVASEVARKLASVFNIPFHQINQVYRQGPTGIHILVSDQVNQTGSSHSSFHSGTHIHCWSCKKCCQLLLQVLIVVFKEVGSKCVTRN